MGGRVIIMASRALCACAKSPDDYDLPSTPDITGKLGFSYTLGVSEMVEAFYGEAPRRFEAQLGVHAGEAVGHAHVLGDPPALAQVLGARPLEVAEVISVVHHPAAVGVFVVDADFHGDYFSGIGAGRQEVSWGGVF